MALENADTGANTGANTGGNDAVEALPTNAPTAPPIPTSPSAATGAPAARPAPEAPAQAPPLTPGPAAPSRSFMGALAHALIGSTMATAARGVKALAGPPPVDSYSTDASGKMTPNYGRDHTADRLSRLALHALEGLSSGAQMPPQKSRMAALAGGLGAGASAVRQQAQQQDSQKRQQAQDEYETQQKAIMNRATIAHNNASVYRDYLDSMTQQWDRDPEYSNTQAVKESLDQFNEENSANKHDYQILTPEQAQALFAPTTTGGQAHDADSHPLGNKVVVGALRPKPMTDNDGKPLTNEDGSPKMQGQVLVMDGTHDGKISLPQAYISDLQRYSGLVGNAKNFKAGDELTPLQFARVNSLRLQAKQKAQVGWEKPETVYKDGKAMKFNAAAPEGEQLREYPEGAQPNIENKPAAQAVETKLKAGQTAEAWAKAREADAKRLTEDGRHIDAFGNVSPLNEKEFNKRYDAYNRSKQYQTLQILQGSYQQFQEAVSDLNSGKELTGAASVVGLFNAIGISATPLAGKGFRINENTIREHVDARGLDQAAYQKLLALKNGDVITPQQLKDYASIATGVYRDSYINAANEEFRQVGIVDVLPRGNNMPIDPMTARLYLTIAGNNPDLATEAAKKHGWVVPAVKGNQ